jgi:hypothetical protein
LLIRIIALSACFTFSCPELYGQKGPLRFQSPFEGFPTDTIILQTSTYIPDSSRVSFAEIRFCSKTENEESILSLAFSNTGGILAFADSTLRQAMRLEKRSAFPFTPFLPNQPYYLVYTPSPGPGDYLAFRLLNGARNEVLDEVYLCIIHLPARISFLSDHGWISAK